MSAVLLLAACPNPVGSGKGGVLAVSINNNINARTLLPAIDMTAASFTVSGIGPDGSTFSQSTSGAPVTVQALAFGPWSVTVNALNGAGTIIGSGQAAVTVHTGQTAAVNITVEPLGGNGTLDVSVSWTGTQVENASIVGSLKPAEGEVIPLSFSITGSTGSFSSTTIPAGYHTLSVQLMDSGMAVMGAVEVVRVVAGQSTSGAYTFANVNQPGGRVAVNISPEMGEPIPVSISGVGATVSAGSGMRAQASVGDGTANVDYVWYLNGVSVGMGDSYTLPATVAAGWYRLDVTAYAGGGTRAGSATASFQVTAASSLAGPFVYVTNFGSNSVSADTVGPGGVLAPLGAAPFAAGVGPFGITATPHASFLYVTNLNGGTISAYSIGPDGLLSALMTSMFAADTRPTGIAVTPNGSFLYAAGFRKNSSVGAFAIADGQFSQLKGSPFSAGGGPFGVAVTPNGSFLYLTNSKSDTVSAYSIDIDGKPTPLSVPSFAAGSSPQAIAVAPNGSFLYVANSSDDNVSAYAIGSDGLLAPLSIPTFETGSQPAAIAITPNGSFLYVANAGSDTVSAFAVGSVGVLTPLRIPSFGTGTGPAGIAITADGSFLYVTNQGSNSVSAYAVGSDGLLTPLTAPTIPTGSQPIGIVVAGGGGGP